MSSLFQVVTRHNQEDEKVVPFQNSKQVHQEIFIKDLELEMFIGVFENEKDSKQRVLISAELEVVPTGNWRADDVNQIVSYADIINMIKVISESGHIDLVETFVEKIIEGCFKNPAIIKASVSVSKPDIIADTGAVGAKITRTR